MKSEVFLLLGTNLGNTSMNLERARIYIKNIGNIVTESSVYRTKAWGKTDQPDFYNQVLGIVTSVEPEELLQKVLSIESEIGRERKEKWGPRVIDIDILFYENRIIELENLSIPHPGIPSRRFVLQPLAEIAPDFIHPQLKKNIRTLLKECPDILEVEKLHS
ncbi:MAG TPA: 2-amino-4-hydroxy-6-hydroxymethyldihydropteridine diphosphokinase [Cyclobacteriaceae bacterium]|jgi:2-amino-4-hydroxy-6-hydroxymethyldihydropteridine diphosphokinase|nr:2-amino-4-hydroxy-6-hydroxymethyldihydropteridine diphosphokinase [Cyclobacteriaceae bacterium]